MTDRDRPGEAGTQVLDRATVPPVDPRLRARRIEVKRSEGRKRLRRVLTALVITLLCAAAWGISRSPLLDVDAVVVDGVRRVTPAAVVETGGIHPRDALVDVDLGVARDAVEALPWVESVRISRSWFGTVRYDVVERRPVAVAAVTDDRLLLVDAAGWVLDEARPTDVQSLPLLVGLDRIQVGERLDGVERRAVELVERSGPALLDWVGAVAVRDGSLWLELSPQAVAAAGGSAAHPGSVQLGDARELDLQLVAAQTMLARVDLSCLEVIDVRVPASPVVRRVEGCDEGVAA